MRNLVAFTVRMRCLPTHVQEVASCARGAGSGSGVVAIFGAGSSGARVRCRRRRWRWTAPSRYGRAGRCSRAAGARLRCV